MGSKEKAAGVLLFSNKSIFTISIGRDSWFPTLFTKNVKRMGHGESLHHQ